MLDVLSRHELIVKRHFQYVVIKPNVATIAQRAASVLGCWSVAVGHGTQGERLHLPRRGSRRVLGQRHFAEQVGYR